MGFNITSLFSEIIASFIVLLRTGMRLIFAPYKTMRVLADDFDVYQVLIILTLIFGYYVYAVAIRSNALNPLLLSSSALISFLYFLLTFVLVLLFFYGAGLVLQKMGHAHVRGIRSLVMTFSYSLLPTLIWFFTTSSLFLVLPPPRYPTVLGTAFSIIFIVFSVTLLLWRIILWYLSLRFVYRARFYSILIVMLAFGVWFVPYTIAMYQYGIFRVPFI